MIIFREYEKYEKLGISINELISINEMLKIPENKNTSNATEKRKKYVEEAISWKCGKDQQNRIITIVYDIDGHGTAVAVGKPGKEADKNYKGFRNYKTGLKGNNPNDMNPHILLQHYSLDLQKYNQISHLFLSTWALHLKHLHRLHHLTFHL